MPFTFSPTALPDVILIESRMFHDDRGYFREGFKASEFAAAGLPTEFRQDNTSRSTKGVVRGLHFQTDPHAQGKLVGVTQGAVLDVAVDIRVGSPTYGQWVAEELSAENGLLLWIPGGFAHGFSVLSDSADLVYKCTHEFVGSADGGISWNDPDLAIDWRVTDPIVSAKDVDLLRLCDSTPGFVYRGPSD
jgi:dTDP-4-dehydrorhamnose 3,5-epimerase